ncbi:MULTISPECIES: DEAD/DEAH box helicase family protein [unclassified Staphylococcus]|uniref:DEAD/DEAH box helicase family protein n=1 Tax=unclassified Staphylococcus TaxID=91994 RepID=UPI0021D2A3DD|nr:MULTISPECIES: DEAD/DEAH box helicase family protein [unclassified Staphylococcus]UXR72034.1 DEAD/DEAH box helicase family protein [Staphylococcus sp. IVB6240]UXR74343.1 DEAD/DEAH box helicase family protein [Staphylococcus sp. IVB6238]UXR76728.1 DEAD/DEAH box helicase family protein [Staphylococcus sp. IVB6233]UXR80857.1 DEAD/DEAH box helicase family protein [Staphylococcus sp. IVB6218]
MLYGQLVNDQSQLTTERIAKETFGVVKVEGTWCCMQCDTQSSNDFYTYPHYKTGQIITYCRKCIQMGRMSTVDRVWITESRNISSDGHYELAFTLSDQQKYASKSILKAVKNGDTLLLHAVTGAGKTEMIFEAIAYARQHGHNVAIVSPRVDVVIEVSKRLCEAFCDESIDVLHQASHQQYDGHFVVSTVHQLYRFKRHFDVIFVDEVDAFPLSMDETLMRALQQASQVRKSIIYMTATPPKKLLKEVEQENVVTLPARFHRHPLVVPKFKYFKVRYHRIQPYLLQRMYDQQSKERVTLLFFSHIDTMQQFYKTYRSHVPKMCYVFSEDPERLEKVQALRDGQYTIMLTTTILERGFTMQALDAWVMESHRYLSTALIQIAGRVGRKALCPTGEVLFFHEGRTRAMYHARKEIRYMNQLATKRGWLDI